MFLSKWFIARRCRGQTWADGGDVTADGYVTAETAMVLPVLALLLAVGLWAVAVAGAQVRCVDAARDAARAAARGESDAIATAVGRAAAPGDAQIELSHRGGVVVVTVTARVGGGLGPLAAIPAPMVTATATAQSEDGP
ncbi:MAG TPA: TadE family type IV pilus minor pilin [Acidothermaceae bacterium]